MTAKRGKRPTKKVKTLKSRSVPVGKTKAVRGGSLGAGLKFGATQTVQGKERFYTND